MTTQTIEVIRRGRAGADGQSSLVGVTTVSSSVSLAVADSGKAFRVTANATLALPSGAPAGWSAIIDADGGTVTVTSTSLINGASSLVIGTGNSAFIYCDGTDFYGRFYLATALTALSASSITFAPYSGNTETDAQAAIAANVDDIEALQDAQSNGTPTTTAGSASAYTLAPPVAITAYAAGQAFWIRASHASTGASTIDVSGLGAKAIVKINASNSTAAIGAGDIATGDVHLIVYDGTQFILATFQPLLDEDTMTSNSAARAPTQQSVKTYVDARCPFARTIAVGILNGTGTPAWALRAGFGATVTDNGAGDYTVAFDAAEPDTNYMVFMTVQGPSGVLGRYYPHWDSLTTSGFDIHINNATGTATDIDGIAVQVVRLIG